MRLSTARERRLCGAGFGVGVRVVGPGAAFGGGSRPGASVGLPARATWAVTVRGVHTGFVLREQA
ncbi:hypothetical protein [Streptomyces sp. V3I7]|uniref:hypothetical protein n=1 Tax=Streptomyces sp. V3I7 TaxID=3042278 RepID=UPI0027817326|nr:hypothetical protein [Streptomyces sp. V3I7]MDQ0993079.1 hypothetical protein [Streptomyces sp. V3I7]